nr:D-alanyl-lipoteichoic acid biosynthesis protein DltD [Bordetella holmesii]
MDPVPAAPSAAPQVGWTPQSAHWPSLHEQAENTELELMANNPYGVRQDYLDTFLRHLTPERMNAYSTGYDPAAELADLERLMALLAQHHVRSLLVLQPLNPLVYRDLDRFEPARQHLLALCTRYAMPCMDMYGALPYAVGTLRDGQHLGELGWLAVSRKITEVMGQ